MGGGNIANEELEKESVRMPSQNISLVMLVYYNIWGRGGVYRDLQQSGTKVARSQKFAARNSKASGSWQTAGAKEMGVTLYSV